MWSIHKQKWEWLQTKWDTKLNIGLAIALISHMYGLIYAYIRALYALFIFISKLQKSGKVLK